MHAVGEQGRRQGIARDAFQDPAVEAESDRLRPVDAPTAGGAKAVRLPTHEDSPGAVLAGGMVGRASPVL
jgi:hypothetical protein